MSFLCETKTGRLWWELANKDRERERYCKLGREGDNEDEERKWHEFLKEISIG